LGALDVGTTLKAGKWGQADAVAKGERGHTAVSSPHRPHHTRLTGSGTPTLLSATHPNHSPSYPIQDPPIYSSTRPHVPLANYPITRPSTPKPLAHLPTSPVDGASNTTTNPVPEDT
jgi:hypothetical protein